MYAAFLKIKDTFIKDLKEKFFTLEGDIKLNNWNKFIKNENFHYGYGD